jgi:glycosyltransferase involved in cell wall biosynthesis
MNSTPLVSVVIPAYNCAQYIALAVQSALDQDYPHKEIIVVDDGSTDNTANVLAGFGERIIVRQQSNSGVAAARNHGMRVARGEFIALLDADDLWLPGKLRKQVDYLAAHPELGAVYCAWREWRPDANGVFVVPKLDHDETTREGIDPNYSGWLFNMLFVSVVIHTTTLLMRRETMVQVGEFDHELLRGQDYDYWFRMSRIAPIHKLKAVLSLYRIHPESITNKPHQANYPCLVIQKAVDQWGRIGPDGTETPQDVINGALSRHWFDFGYMHLCQGDPKLAYNAFVRSIRLRPARMKAWVNTARSLVKMAR